MKVKREMSSGDSRNVDKASVHDRLGGTMGRSWSRAENRLDKNSGIVKRESPRKRVKTEDLRTKIRMTLDDDKDRKNEDNSQALVEFRVPKYERETDEEVLKRREKQLDYGKNTVDYDKYLKLVPKKQRTDRMPRTPNKNLKHSRRAWDGMVKKWKQDIHSTVAKLEGQEEDFMSTGRLSSIGSWADDVEEEEQEEMRARTRASSTSSDQGLGNSMCSSADESPFEVNKLR